MTLLRSIKTNLLALPDETKVFSGPRPCLHDWRGTAGESVPEQAIRDLNKIGFS